MKERKRKSVDESQDKKREGTRSRKGEREEDIKPPPKPRVKQVAKKLKFHLESGEKSIKFCPFISVVAKAYFIKVLPKKKFIKKRGLNWDNDQCDQEIKDLILAHRWQTLCENLSNA